VAFLDSGLGVGEVKAQPGRVVLLARRGHRGLRTQGLLEAVEMRVMGIQGLLALAVLAVVQVRAAMVALAVTAVGPLSLLQKRLQVLGLLRAQVLLGRPVAVEARGQPVVVGAQGRLETLVPTPLETPTTTQLAQGTPIHAVPEVLCHFIRGTTMTMYAAPIRILATAHTRIPVEVAALIVATAVVGAIIQRGITTMFALITILGTTTITHRIIILIRTQTPAT